MPIFEYRCGECRKKFERIVLSASAREVPACPHCGGAKAEKLVSRFATASKSGGGDFGSDFGEWLVAGQHGRLSGRKTPILPSTASANR